MRQSAQAAALGKARVEGSLGGIRGHLDVY